MKKIITILLALVLCFSVCACGNECAPGFDEDTTQVIESFFAQTNYDYRATFLEENSENYPLLTNEELDDLIVGNWLCMNVESLVCEDWWVYEYKDNNKRYQREYIFINSDKETTEEEYWLTDEESISKNYSVENGKLIMGGAFGSSEYEFRKVHDNFYYVTDDSGANYLYVQLNPARKMVYSYEEWAIYPLYDRYH